MEFLEMHDWLNRVGPYAFKLDHILAVVIGLLIGVLLCLILRKKSEKTVKDVLICLWALAVTVEVFYYGYTYIMCAVDPVNHPFILDDLLPFHSCFMFLYVFPVAMFAKNKIVKTCALNFLVIINMIIGFITLFVGCPPVGYSVLSFKGMQSMILHLIIVIVPLIMVVTKFYDIQKSDLKFGLITFFVLGLVMWIFDAIAGCDYFYFYDGHTFPVLKVISENVHHLVWTLIVVSCYVITGVTIHFLIIGIKCLVNKKQHSSGNETIENKE